MEGANGNYPARWNSVPMQRLHYHCRYPARQAHVAGRALRDDAMHAVCAISGKVAPASPSSYLAADKKCDFRAAQRRGRSEGIVGREERQSGEGKACPLGLARYCLAGSRGEVGLGTPTVAFAVATRADSVSGALGIVAKLGPALGAPELGAEQRVLALLVGRAVGVLGQ